jgi:outer membrane usher protein FimD/PapC
MSLNNNNKQKQKQKKDKRMKFSFTLPLSSSSFNAVFSRRQAPISRNDSENSEKQMDCIRILLLEIETAQTNSKFKMSK